MKLYHILFSFAILLLIAFPTTFAFSDKLTKVEANVDDQGIVIPDSMKNNITHEETITFPDPKKSAIEMINLFYQMKIYKCNLGLELWKNVKRLVQGFTASARPNNQSTPQQVLINKKHLEKTMDSIKAEFEPLNKSGCAAFLKAESRRFRRIIFLLTLRYISFENDLN